VCIGHVLCVVGAVLDIDIIVLHRAVCVDGCDTTCYTAECASSA